MLENFSKKIVAKIDEIIDTKKATGLMTEAQKSLTNERLATTKELEKTGVKVTGEVKFEILGKNEGGPNTGFGGSRIGISGFFDNQEIKIELDSITISRRPYQEIETNFHCVVDGEEITSKEETSAIWKKIRQAAPIAHRIQNIKSSDEKYTV